MFTIAGEVVLSFFRKWDAEVLGGSFVVSLLRMTQRRALELSSLKWAPCPECISDKVRNLRDLPFATFLILPGVPGFLIGTLRDGIKWPRAVPVAHPGPGGHLIKTQAGSESCS